jgi:hypothetical protein
MAFATQQITLVASTATPLLVQGTTGTKFNQIVGQVTDPIPVQFMITSGTVYWGGPNVSASNGFLMVANSPVIVNCYGPSEIPYCFSTGTPTIYVACGRQ